MTDNKILREETFPLCLCSEWRNPPGNITDHVPPGQLVDTFTAINGEAFEIWRCNADDQGAVDLIARLEKVALWFIETADSVDFSDKRWKASLLFQKTNNNDNNNGDNNGNC